MRLTDIIRTSYTIQHTRMMIQQSCSDDVIFQLYSKIQYWVNNDNSIEVYLKQHHLINISCFRISLCMGTIVSPIVRMIVAIVLLTHTTSFNTQYSVAS